MKCIIQVMAVCAFCNKHNTLKASGICTHAASTARPHHVLVPPLEDERLGQQHAGHRDERHKQQELLQALLPRKQRIALGDLRGRQVTQVRSVLCKNNWFHDNVFVAVVQPASQSASQSWRTNLSTCPQRLRTLPTPRNM